MYDACMIRMIICAHAAHACIDRDHRVSLDPSLDVITDFMVTNGWHGPIRCGCDRRPL
jgi:hypothetical protein